MATQTVEFLTISGQTVTAKLFAFGSDTEVASASATEATNRKGTYTAAFTDVAAGTYRLIALNVSSVPLASWDVALTLTTATFQAVEIGTAAIKSKTDLIPSDIGSVIISSNSNREVLVTGSKHIAADVHAFQTNVIDSDALAASAVTEIQNGLATAASQTLILDSSNFNLCVLAGTIADAGTAGETYTIIRNGSTYTIDFTGLDSTGNRTGQTLTKT